MPYTGRSEEEQCRKLFIGGISLETTDDILNDYFSEWGNITDCVVIKDGSTGRSKGFGFVTYESETEADACMAKRPHNLLGRQIDVKRAVSREESMKPGAHVQVKKVFIGGISPDCTEEWLREYFQSFGDIDSCEIPHDRDNNKPRGFAFVTFSDFDTVDKLVSKRVHEFSGMRCEVKKALSKQEMEKAKTQVEMKSSQRYGGRGGKSFGGGGGRGGSMRGGGGRGGGGARYGHGGGDNRYAGGDSHGYSDYDDYSGGYEGYGGRGGSTYGRGGSNYGRGGSNYGPMRNQSGYRDNGPYGGGYGGGNGYGAGNGYGGYGSGGNGGGYENSGYGGYSNW